MAKIHTVIDTYSFRQGNITSAKIIAEKLEGVRAQIKERFLDADKRIGETDDIPTLQKLDAYKKFLMSVAEILDIQNNHITYLTESFTTIDENYWSGAIHYQKIIDENTFLKDTVAAMQKRESLLINGWRSERNKWNKDRLKIGRAA